MLPKKSDDALIAAMRIKNTLAFFPRLAILIAMASLAAGCNEDVAVNSTSTPASASSPSGAPPPAPSVQLSGTPATSVIVGNAYEFQPTVTAGGTVTFTITGKPSWMAFNAATGALSGTPAANAEGSSGQITITGRNGTSSASIGPFIVQVAAPATTPAATTGAAALSWIAPTTNTNGAPVTDLSGYHIYYGTEADALTSSIDVAGASTTTYTVTGLRSGTYFFTVVAYNSEGTDSPESNLESKTI